jgi:hypothetical protein
MSYAIGFSPAVSNVHGITADAEQAANAFTRRHMGEAANQIEGGRAHAPSLLSISLGDILAALAYVTGSCILPSR